jgi:hypothetical protein
MKIKPTTVMAVLGVLLVLAIIAYVSLLTTGCHPIAHALTPISSSHSQLTASEYDLAEAEFGGGAVTVPEPYWTDVRCQELINRRDGLLIAAACLGGLTGVGGLASLIPKDATEKEKDDWAMGLGISTLGVGITASTLTFAAQTLTRKIEENCRVEKEAPEVSDGGV